MSSAVEILQGFVNKIFHLPQIGYEQSSIDSRLVTSKNLSLHQFE